MPERKLIVIGGDAAGMTAASKIRREQPEREIIVFERGHHTSYAACGMPYYIGGQVDSAENLIARKPEVFREKQNIDVRIRHEVTEIDVERKRVKVKNLDSEEDYWVGKLSVSKVQPNVLTPLPLPSIQKLPHKS